MKVGSPYVYCLYYVYLPGCEEIEHGSDAEHDASRDGIPLQPKRDEGGSDEDNVRNKNSREVKGSVPIEHQLHIQTTVVTWPIYKIYSYYPYYSTYTPIQSISYIPNSDLWISDSREQPHPEKPHLKISHHKNRTWNF